MNEDELIALESKIISLQALPDHRLSEIEIGDDNKDRIGKAESSNPVGADKEAK
jgi:hypothetical protein